MAVEEQREREDENAVPMSRWGSLVFRDFQLFWAHGLLQGVSRNMRDALTYYVVFDLSGSALQLGVTGMFQAVPIILFGLLGGALADSMDRKKLLVYTQVANLASMVLLAALVFSGLVQVWHLWLLVSFWSAVNVVGRPAQRAYLPRMVPRSHIMNAITWFGSLSQGTLFAGPLIAGLFIAFVSIGWAYVANAAFLLLAVIATMAIRASGRQEGEPRKVSVGAIWEGVRFLKTREVLLATYLMDFGVMSFGFFRPLMPILTLKVYMVGGLGFGILSAAPAVGAILGSVTLLMIGDPPRKGIMILLSYVAYTLGLIALGLSPWFLMALAVLAVLGFMDVISFTARQALIQLVSPDRFRGRVGSLSTILSGLGNSTGSTEMGALAAVVGAPGALIINGFVGLGITAASGLKWMGLWRYDQRKEKPED